MNDPTQALALASPLCWALASAGLLIADWAFLDCRAFLRPLFRILGR